LIILLYCGSRRIRRHSRPTDHRAGAQPHHRLTERRIDLGDNRRLLQQRGLPRRQVEDGLVDEKQAGFEIVDDDDEREGRQPRGVAGPNPEEARQRRLEGWPTALTATGVGG
jgi:hypothetical protein